MSGPPAVLRVPPDRHPGRPARPRGPAASSPRGVEEPAGSRSLSQGPGAGRATWTTWSAPCQHPVLDARDPDQQVTPRSTTTPPVTTRSSTSGRHGRPDYCRQHVVGLGDLRTDLRTVRGTPNLAYITPDLCHDGHDTPCADGRPGGLVTVNSWMKAWVPRILASPAFRRDGLLVITADESDSPQSDSTACCGEGLRELPDAGIAGPGGGRIGALVISRLRVRRDHEHHRVQPLLAAGLDRGGLRPGEARVRRRGRAGALRPRRLQQRLERVGRSAVVVHARAALLVDAVLGDVAPAVRA